MSEALLAKPKPTFNLLGKPKGGKFDLGPNHQPAIKVPKGGSMCKNCKFLGKDEKTCVNKYFIAWHGSKDLPEPYDEYCSDWYEPQEAV